MRGKILIVTNSGELNIDRVLPFIPETEEVVRINTDNLLRSSVVAFRITQSGTDWSFEAEGKTVEVSEVKSIWYRRPHLPKPGSTTDPQYHDFVRKETQHVLFSLWTSTPQENILWVNHPLPLTLLEFNKPYQMQAAREVGLVIPATLITTSPDQAVDFFEHWNGEVIIKTFGGHVLKDEQERVLSIYTNRVTREQIEAHGDEIRLVPIMLQNYVPKSFELRITAVGRRLFACAIHSQDSPRTRDDWRRYDFENVKHQPHQLPTQVETKLLELMRSLQLQFGAIDMIVTPDGEYVFLEVNPSGQWGWIETLTGMPISQAIAELLLNPQKHAL